MLKTIDPIVTAPLLAVLAEMGHGDAVAIVDANFPAASMGRRVVDMPGLPAPRVLEAVLSLLPLDTFVDQPAATMRPIDPADASAIFGEFQDACDRAENRGVSIETIDRFAFYERVRAAFAVVQTGERRLYGNILLVKGVVRAHG